MLDGLNQNLIDTWLTRAKEEIDYYPPFAFISSWIAFNHYYATFTKKHLSDYKTYVRSKFGRRGGDKAEWNFLINHSFFSTFYGNYCRNNTELLTSIKIQLPVKNVMMGRDVPNGVHGEKSLFDLTPQQTFEVIYQIRNNLFHGVKDPDKVLRDEVLTLAGAQFLIPFMDELIIA